MPRDALHATHQIQSDHRLKTESISCASLQVIDALPICAHQEHRVSRLLVQELFDVGDSLLLIQCSMEGEHFDLRSLPVHPPQRILNLSACLNLTPPQKKKSICQIHCKLFLVADRMLEYWRGTTLLQKIIVLRTGDSSIIFTSADFLFENAVSGFFSSLSSPLQSTRICSSTSQM